MSTNISDKEKKVLMILGICVIIFVYFYVFFIPKIKSINSLKEKIEVYNNEYKVNHEYMIRVQNLDSELKILYQKQKNLWKILPPCINYDEMLLLLKDSASKSKLTVNEIQFESALVVKSESEKNQDTKSDTGAGSSTDKNSSASPAPKETSKPTNSNAKTTDSGKTDSSKKAESEVGKGIKDNKLLQAMKFFGITNLVGLKDDENASVVEEGNGFYLPVSINATGTYQQVKDFIKIVKSKRNKMEFADIIIENTLESNLNFNLKLFVFGIKDSSVKDFTFITDEKKSPVKNNGNSNIFSATTGIDKNMLNNVIIDDNNLDSYSELDKSIVSKIGKYDFSIRLLPFGNNMAPPSISIVGKNVIQGTGTNLIPTIYGDGNKYIYTDFEIQEKNKKYYVKFRTEQDSFPEQSFTELAEFKPVGDNFVLIVDSTERKFKNDKAGINLNIFNSTKKNFIVKVINDDKENPRLKVGKISNNVKLEFNKKE